eukprot:6888633-Pyramimonas_sp.AAC.1
MRSAARYTEGSDTTNQQTGIASAPTLSSGLTQCRQSVLSAQSRRDFRRSADAGTLGPLRTHRARHHGRLRGRLHGRLLSPGSDPARLAAPAHGPSSTIGARWRHMLSP